MTGHQHPLGHASPSNAKRPRWSAGVCLRSPGRLRWTLVSNRWRVWWTAFLAIFTMGTWTPKSIWRPSSMQVWKLLLCWDFWLSSMHHHGMAPLVPLVPTQRVALLLHRLPVSHSKLIRVNMYKRYARFVQGSKVRSLRMATTKTKEGCNFP